MDKRVKRGLRAARPKYQDGGALPFVSIPPDDLAKAQADPQRYERFFEPIAAGVKSLGDLVKAPFDMARDARQAGGYSQLNPTDVGRAGLNTGLGTLMPAVGGVGGRGGAVLMSGAGPTDKGIKAYHGSPHDFDRFDMSKIGTGEGAQAYGHGLYFAESEGVAKSYRDALGTYADAVKWKGEQPPNELQQQIINELRGFDATRGVAPKVGDLRMDYIRALRSVAKYDDEGNMIRPDGPRGNDYDRLHALIAETRKVEPNIELTQPGRMYEVRIDADPNDFLDWDKPLSQQSEKVRGAVNPYVARLRQKMIDDASRWGTPSSQEMANYAKQADDITGRVTGQDLYEKIREDLHLTRKKPQPFAQSDVEMANRLQKAGIPGIKYLDQGSRTAGEGSRNYVLFRDDIVQIVRKYGMAAAVSMYGADAVNDALQPMTTGNDG